MGTPVAVTSFSRKLYESYAHRLIASAAKWPTRISIYSEDKLPFAHVDLNRVCPKLAAFQAKCPPAPSYHFDAARFATKVFAFCHAAWNADDLVFWLDADIVMHEQITIEFLRGLLPEGFYAGYFGREGLYTETGFHMVDARHPANRAFLEEFRKVYLDGTIFRLPQWHDCMAYDFVREQFEQAGVKFHNLSGEFSNHPHPIVMSPLGEFLDHTKGPNRKRQGYSHERLSQRSAVLGDVERPNPGMEGRVPGAVAEL